MRLIGLFTLTLFLAKPVLADPPNVAADIAPLHSLVASVMEGVAEPQLLLQPGASPHHGSLRPSQAQALRQADFVYWIGPGLTPWLFDSLAALAGKATIVTLSEESPHTLSFRDMVLEPEDDHGHEDEHTNDHDHGHDHEDDHSAVDPHLWLDLENAMGWVAKIRDDLATHDAENADTYARNAEGLLMELEALASSLGSRFDGGDTSYLAGHDTFQYFEHHTGLTFKGAISLGDASKPGPRRIQSIRQIASDTGVTCLAVDSTSSPDLIETVRDGTPLRPVPIDALGRDQEPGPALYVRMMQDMGAAFETCLAKGS